MKRWGVTEVEKGTDVVEPDQGVEEEDLIAFEVVVQGSGQGVEGDEEEEAEVNLIEWYVEED